MRSTYLAADETTEAMFGGDIYCEYFYLEVKRIWLIYIYILKHKSSIKLRLTWPHSKDIPRFWVLTRLTVAKLFHRSAWGSNDKHFRINQPLLWWDLFANLLLFLNLICIWAWSPTSKISYGFDFKLELKTASMSSNLELPNVMTLKWHITKFSNLGMKISRLLQIS